MTVSVNFARRPFRDNRPILLTIGIALVLGLLLLTLNVRDYYAFRRSSAGTLAEIARLNDSAARTEEAAARERSGLASVQLAELQMESTMLNVLLKEREFSWSLLLSRLEHALPPDVYVTRLSPSIQANGDASLTLDFIGKGPDSIVKTLSALARDRYFRSPVPSSESDPERGAPEGFQFHLTVQYLPRGEAAS